MDMSFISKKKASLVSRSIMFWRCLSICLSVRYTSACLSFWQPVRDTPFASMTTVKILNIGTRMSEQTVYILIRLLLRSSLIRIYTVCQSFYIFWRHYLNVKLNCFILRTTTVAGLGVPIFRVITVVVLTDFSKVDMCIDF